MRDDQRFGRNNASKQEGTRKTSWSPSGVNFASRQSALTHTLKPKGQERLLRLVTMYHPAVKIRKQILMEHWSLLHSQPLLKTISTNLWSSLTKKGKSLEDMLVRAKKNNKIKFEGDTATPHGKSLPLFSCARSHATWSREIDAKQYNLSQILSVNPLAI